MYRQTRNYTFVSSVFAILAVILLISQRIIMAAPYLKETITNFVLMLTSERDLSYEYKMAKLQGKGYIFAKKITNHSPKNSRIIFPTTEFSDLRPIVLSYFLYPRQTRNIGEIGELEKIKKADDVENYLIFYKNFPGFEIAAMEVIVFGDNLDDLDETFKNATFKPGDPIYSGKSGIIKLWE